MSDAVLTQDVFGGSSQVTELISLPLGQLAELQAIAGTPPAMVYAMSGTEVVLRVGMRSTKIARPWY
eukprot:2533325-Rhodomonas_salina.2